MSAGFHMALRCIYAFASSNNCTSPAHKAIGYQYSWLSIREVNQIFFRKGFAMFSHQSAKNIFIAGRFLL
jgi:hypothetical protein